MKNDSLFTVGAAGVDVGKIVEEIKTTVAEKKARGDYADPRVVRAERTNLANLRNDNEFMAYYMDCLRDSMVVDINDFQIVERRAGLAKLLIALKTVIWKLLKFYTYRLWSQQNQTNTLLFYAIEDTQNKHRKKIEELEERIARLESSQK